MAKPKTPAPGFGKRPTRAEILKAAGWEPTPVGLLPEKLRKAEDRRMQDYLVSWTLGMWDHMKRLDNPKAASARPKKE